MAELAWSPQLGLDDSVQMTVEWYKQHQAGADGLSLSLNQIGRYSKWL
jgi:dTDP-D-glucose 4,6-dehydratase